MPEILTDADVLREPSVKANDLEVGNIVEQLSVSIPGDALGLSAPQIGIKKRVFLANLSSGSFVFMNPTITWKSADKLPSEEGCLSIPGCHRCIERHAQVSVSCDKLIDLRSNDLEVDAELRLRDRDAFIVQHETDHLDGILITDHPSTLTVEQRRSKTQEDRRKRIEAGRLKKQLKQKSTPQKPQKISAKKEARLKREAKKRKRRERTQRRQNKIRVEIEERYKMEKEGLFTKSETTSNDAENAE
jgi:peptide deformylase